MHLADADRQGRHPGLSPQPAQGLVLEAAGRHDQRRLRGDLRAERAAAEPAGAACERVFPGLSLPRPASRHAHEADRHRTVQAGRFQARRFHPAGSQSRLLEKGQALSRRDHLSRDRQPRHADAGFFDRRFRYHLSFRGYRHPDAGRQGALSGRHLRDHELRNANQSDGEPRQSAVRQSGHSQSDVAGDRSQTVQYDSDGRPGAARRRHAAQAGGRMGDAAGYGVAAYGIWPGQRKQHRASAGDHAEARL